MTPGSPLPAVCAGAAAAGPVFVTSSAIASLYLELPAAVTVEVPQVVAFLVLLLPVLAIGFFPAFVIGLLGSLIMSTLPTRRHEAWVAAGAAVGCVLAAVFEAAAGNSFGLVAASSVCAWICWYGFDAD